VPLHGPLGEPYILIRAGYPHPPGPAQRRGPAPPEPTPSSLRVPWSCRATHFLASRLVGRRRFSALRRPEQKWNAAPETNSVRHSRLSMSLVPPPRGSGSRNFRQSACRFLLARRPKRLSRHRTSDGRGPRASAEASSQAPETRRLEREGKRPCRCAMNRELQTVLASECSAQWSASLESIARSWRAALTTQSLTSRFSLPVAWCARGAHTHTRSHGALVYES